MRYIKNIVIWLSAVLTAAACTQAEPDYRDHQYGHVQFKLYKAASYDDTQTKAVLEQLDYLKDVTKIKVALDYEGNRISQTLPVNASDDNAAEFGLRSDKLKLLAGSYKVLTFTLYDRQDQALYVSTPSEAHSTFDVVAGGLVVHDLLASVVERGKVRFSLTKDMDSFENMPDTKASSNEYTFDEIAYVSVTVRTGNTTLEPFEMLPADFSIHFTDDGVEDGYQTSSFVCDTLVSLRAGEYDVVRYELYDEGKDLLEANADVKATFTVEDNRTTKAEIPVKLRESMEYIKDYYALYEIWKALHGEDWYYVGENFPAGSNWDFNKDPDLWGDQPGVSLHSNGRVALLNLSDFGFYGAGTLYYDRALALSEQASQELDDNKYMALVKEFEQALLNAIDPFEKAFAISKNDQLKLNVAEYLKNIYYRFSSTDEKYMEGYRKYDAMVKSGSVN